LRIALRGSGPTTGSAASVKNAIASAEAAMDDVSRHHVERTAAEALAATVPASRAGVAALVGYLRDLERSLPRNDDLYGAMPEGFEAAVRENIRLALTSLA
jgi:flavin-binding protein dodecin